MRNIPVWVFVMPGLVPGIHIFLSSGIKQDVDGRDKSLKTRVALLRRP